ncbi:MAG: 5-oxoprolinase subunit PxpB [Luteimonas sp.]
MSDWRAEALGEDVLLLRFGDRIDVAINQRVHALAAKITARRPSWLQDVVPAYASLALFVDRNAFAADVDPLSETERWLQAQAFAVDVDNDTIPGRSIEVPVRYGGEDGPDLDDLARHAGLSIEETVLRHAGGDYRVAMLGFAAGFPYLLGMDAALAMPRLQTPRTRVAAGSIAIGGAQTGIYPRQGPGGWRIIGRTDCALFDPVRAPPTLIAPGDRVRFVAIDVRNPQ